jgi:hypothetical protein
MKYSLFVEFNHVSYFHSLAPLQQIALNNIFALIVCFPMHSVGNQLCALISDAVHLVYWKIKLSPVAGFSLAWENFRRDLLLRH